MKLGIICSSGGSTILKALSFLKSNKFKLVVVVDRDCKIIPKCKKRNISVKKIPYDKNFDNKSKIFFKTMGVDSVLLLLQFSIIRETNKDKVITEIFLMCFIE